MAGATTAAGDEGRHVRFPILALCWQDPAQPGEDFLIECEVDGHLSVAFYHDARLAAAAVREAVDRTGFEHRLMTIAGADGLIEVLAAVPFDVSHVAWDRPVGGGDCDVQGIDGLLGWQMRHK